MAFTPGAFAAENESGTAADLYIIASADFDGVGASYPSDWTITATALFEAVAVANNTSDLSIAATGTATWASGASEADFSISATGTVNPVGASSNTAMFNINSGGLLFLVYPNATDIGNMSMQATSTLSIFGRSRMVDTRKIGTA